MGEKGKAMTGMGEASGKKRLLAAAETAISNPLIEDPLDQAREWPLNRSPAGGSARARSSNLRPISDWDDKAVARFAAGAQLPGRLVMLSDRCASSEMIDPRRCPTRFSG